MTHRSPLSEARHVPPREDCPHPEWWGAEDAIGTEFQVSELVAAFCRALQPRLVVETGAYRGQTTELIAMALEKNGHGRLISLELDKANRRAAMKRLLAHDFKNITWDVLLQSSLEWYPDAMIDFMWIDSGDGPTREEEFRRYFPAFWRGTIVAFHDTLDSGGVVSTTGMAKHVAKLEAEGLIRPIHLPTPRSVTFCNVLTTKKRWGAP
jgi:predicted O-methyltransferase YrrM